MSINPQNSQTDVINALVAATTVLGAGLNRVSDRLDTVVGMPPDSLNTLQELATALNGDPNILSGKAALSGANFTGNVSLAAGKTLTVGTGATSLGGTLGVAGDLAVNNDKFKVVAASGNTTVAGTLVTGAATIGSTLDVSGNVAVATNKFTVASASGNTSVAGTLSAGASTLASAAVTGDLAVNTNKFTVASASGNTSVAGTLSVGGTFGVTGATTLAGLTAGATTFNESVSLAANKTLTGIIVHTGTAPTTASSTGTAGTILYDSSYIYVCTAANTWKRVGITSW